MNREQIEQAAEDYSAYIDGNGQEYNTVELEAFMDGAEWRINSVWHGVEKELPECNKHVVNEDWLDFAAKDEKDLKRILKTYSFKRWAYVDDLLPERKEDAE